ncbi:MAG: hypothetical protein ACUVS2_15210 [Candidatus Flexifilum sp.]
MTAAGTSWNMLYAAADDQTAVVDALVRALTMSGYQIYDAYGSAFPPAFARAVRSFVAPSIGGWTRIVGEIDSGVLPLLSIDHPLIEARIAAGETEAGVEVSLTVWLDGSALDADAAAAAAALGRGWLAFIAAGIARLNAPETAASADPPPQSAGPSGFVPREVLPGYARGLFDDLNPEQAGSLFNRMTASLADRFGRAQMDAARNLLQPRAIDWTAGRPAILAALLSELYGGSAAWRDPDFVTLRDAYQLHIRRRERPGAPLYPGDAEALAAVPDALAYVPVYAGRSA